jgi:hypothetical protein
MDTFIYLTAGPLFVVSFSGYLYANWRLRKETHADLDDYYWEVEDRHPALAKYGKWSRITFAVAAVSALAIFIAAAV